MGACSPTCAGDASAGMGGAVARVEVEEGVEDGTGAAALVRWAPAPSERPGAIAETSAANPAVSAAAASSAKRRVRLTRRSAASRSS